VAIYMSALSLMLACMWSEFLLNMTELHLLCLLSVFVYPKFLKGQNSVT